MLGKTITVLFEGYDDESNLYFGRSVADSPDIDGRVYFDILDKDVKEGEFLNIKINKFDNCDLIGEIV